MRRRDLPATKSTLLQLKSNFEFVQAGHALLDQKREVLLEELIDIFREAGQTRREVERALAAAYAALRESLLAQGRAALEAEALGTEVSPVLRIRERTVMGVIVPLLDVDLPTAPAITAAPGWATAGAVRVQRAIHELLPLLIRLTEIEVSCRRLATELRKTKRKVNALEHIFIPEYRDTIRFIEDTLEEKDREALFQVKRLKDRHAASAEEGGR